MSFAEVFGIFAGIVGVTVGIIAFVQYVQHHPRESRAVLGWAFVIIIAMLIASLFISRATSAASHSPSLTPTTNSSRNGSTPSAPTAPAAHQNPPPATATATTAATTNQNPPPAPTATPTPAPPDCGSYVDLGNLQSESGHNVAGWAGLYTNQPPSPSGDTTFRYQPRGSQATVMVCVPQAGIPYTLTTEVQDFGCDDSFEIFVNGGSSPIYTYQGTRANVVRVHTISIPASAVGSYNLVLGFESISTEDCGYAGVYNVGVASA